MKKISFKKILTTSLISLVFIQMFYSAIAEPTVVTAAAIADDVIVTLVVDSGIAITSPTDVTMAPNIGISANSSIGTAVWNVKTNHATGYSLGVKALTSPALKNGAISQFADYQTGTPTVWAPTASSYQFGYSAFGTTVSTTTWGTGANCGASGVPTGTLKYKGFTTTDAPVATQATVTSNTGVDTTVCFAAAQNGVYAPAGTYTATVTATATEI
jgi:hypothetical protein